MCTEYEFLGVPIAGGVGNFWDLPHHKCRENLSAYDNIYEAWKLVIWTYFHLALSRVPCDIFWGSFNPPAERWIGSIYIPGQSWWHLLCPTGNTICCRIPPSRSQNNTYDVTPRSLYTNGARVKDIEFPKNAYARRLGLLWSFHYASQNHTIKKRLSCKFYQRQGNHPTAGSWHQKWSWPDFTGKNCPRQLRPSLELLVFTAPSTLCFFFHFPEKIREIVKMSFDANLTGLVKKWDGLDMVWKKLCLGHDFWSTKECRTMPARYKKWIMLCRPKA